MKISGATSPEKMQHIKYNFLGLTMSLDIDLFKLVYSYFLARNFITDIFRLCTIGNI